MQYEATAPGFAFRRCALRKARVASAYPGQGVRVTELTMFVPGMPAV